MTSHIFNLDILKYPRTPHIEGSRLKCFGDSDDHVPYAHLAGRHIVVEEKLDGANSALSFSPCGATAAAVSRPLSAARSNGRQRAPVQCLQARASAHKTALMRLLEDRYVMYGEWLHAKHLGVLRRAAALVRRVRHLGPYAPAAACAPRSLRDVPAVSVPVLHAMALRQSA